MMNKMMAAACLVPMGVGALVALRSHIETVSKDNFIAMERDEANQYEQFLVESEQYREQREAWLRTAGDDQTSVALKALLIAYVQTANDLKRLEAFDDRDDFDAKRVMLLQLNLDRSSFRGGLALSRERLLAH